MRNEYLLNRILFKYEFGENVNESLRHAAILRSADRGRAARRGAGVPEHEPLCGGHAGPEYPSPCSRRTRTAPINQRRRRRSRSAKSTRFLERYWRRQRCFPPLPENGLFRGPPHQVSNITHAAEDRSALGYQSFLTSSAPSVVASPDDCFVGRVHSKSAFVVLPAANRRDSLGPAVAGCIPVHGKGLSHLPRVQRPEHQPFMPASGRRRERVNDASAPATQPNLGHLKKQAKDVLRVSRHRSLPWRLADAQHALAHGYGFPSWLALKRYVESVRQQRGTGSSAPRLQQDATADNVSAVPPAASAGSPKSFEPSHRGHLGHASIRCLPGARPSSHGRHGAGVRGG